LKEKKANQVFVNIVKQQKLNNTIGQMYQENTKEICQTLRDCADRATQNSIILSGQKNGHYQLKNMVGKLLKYQLFNPFSSTKEHIMNYKTALWIANKLPQKVVYACFFRFWAHATTFEEGGSITPDEMTWTKAVELWERKYGEV